MKKILYPIYMMLLIAIAVSCKKEDKPAPIADFRFKVKNNCVPTEVEFKNQSLNASVFRWNFGDGTPIKYEANPTHIFDHAGIDTVELTVYGNGGMNILKIPVPIKDLVAEFYSNIQSTCNGQQINFFDYTLNTPTSWSWDFGDGTTSTNQNPVHTYNASGTYNVSLSVGNETCRNTKTKNTYITIGSFPFVNFSANTTSINAGNSVNFTDLSQNATNWNWIFPGGNPPNSTQQNPQGIIYSTPGTYNVSLTITNQCSASSITNSGYIQVNADGSAPIAEFIANPIQIQVGQSVNFADQSANFPTSWNWTFNGGNPNSSTLQNPTYIIYNTIGNYDVTLNATNANGTTTKTKTAYINVHSAITKAYITKITVNQIQFPLSQTVNMFYQISDTLLPPTILLDGKPYIKNNTTPLLMPISWILSPQFQVPSLNNPYRINLFDERYMPPPTSTNLIGFVRFKLQNYTSGMNAYPPSITLSQGSVSITLDLLWQ